MVRPNFTKEICVICKGSRLLCGKPKCPILLKQYAAIPIKRLTFSKEILGSSPPSFFVGHQKYPNVLAGPMIPPITGEDSAILDDVDRRWFGKTIDEIVNYRMMLVRTWSPKLNISSHGNMVSWFSSSPRRKAPGYQEFPSSLHCTRRQLHRAPSLYPGAGR